MSAIILFCLLVGVAFGVRFKITALAPVAIAIILGVTCLAMARGDQSWSVVVISLSSAIALQLGYFCGSFAHHVLDAGRSRMASSSASRSIHTSA